MRKLFLAIALAAVAGASPAAAGQHEALFRRNHAPAEDLAAYADARLAALKAGLQLKSEQEKNWPALETALREVAKAQLSRMAERGEKTPPAFESDPLGALQLRAQMMTQRAAELDKIATAAKPLYDSLDEAQKRRFGPLLRSALERRAHGARHMGQGGFGAGPD